MRYSRAQPLNVIFLVVDSLRQASLDTGSPQRPHTPFLDELSTAVTTFRRAYAAECWTLPAHCSMFTGLLPSQHHAHFQTMGYDKPAPTIAEILRDAGLHTELVTRNFIFDGTVPGITRGFAFNTRLLSELGRFHPFALMLALSKPRNRRLIRSTGFFHPLHREGRDFLTTYARAMLPADTLSLNYLLDRATALRQHGQPFFVFCNLYDVHWPYPPTRESVLRSWSSPRGALENLESPFVLPSIGSHGYLRAGFHLSERRQRILRARYHRAIELMDEKLAHFFVAARTHGLLDDTLLIITSDHGEAFGEHGLYLHDASAYNVHLHVPLWIHHPGRSPEAVDDVVTTRDLFGLVRAVGLGEGLAGTILDAGYRASHPVAIAEHFYYPHVRDMLPKYRQNIVAAIGRTQKVIVRHEGAEQYELNDDPGEASPRNADLAAFAAACQRNGKPPHSLDDALNHLRNWQPLEHRPAAPS